MNSRFPDFRRAASAALAAAVLLGTPATSRAITLNPGDIIVGFVGATSELIGNLGPLNPTQMSQVDISTAGFGSVASTRFYAVGRLTPDVGQPDLVWTSVADATGESALNIDVASQAVDFDFDDSNDYKGSLNGAPATGFISGHINEAGRIVTPTSTAWSYTSKLNAGGSGSDRINTTLTNPIVLTVPGTGNGVVDLYYGQLQQFPITTLLGTLTVTTLDANTVRVKFNPVPEPGTLLLVGAGLAGLARYGRRRLA